MSAFNTLRYTAIAEGISYLALLFIAMPLKYGIGIDMAVKIIGMAHGILFILLCAVLAYTLWRSIISFPMCVLVFIASLFPFGAFWADQTLREGHGSV